MKLHLCLTTLAALGALTACQSTQGESQPATALDSTSGAAPRATVNVTGAGATVEDDGSITLNYPENDDINYRVPDWIINPALGGVTGSVGVASRNALGTREQLDEARWNGRLELASMLELRVQRIWRSELEQDVRVEGEADASRSRRESLGIDKEILDTVLAGTRQRALWWDTETGEVFVWMVVDGALLERVAHDVIQDVSVFTATARLQNEYLPKRAQPLAPTVIVQMPEAPTVAPEPMAPPTPTEALEGALKPIETIPMKDADGEGEDE